MSAADWCEPIVTQGVLGWGNRKLGLEAYGSGGRWAEGTEAGDLLGDALEREGGTEGMGLVVVAIDRFAATKDRLDYLADVVREAVALWEAGVKRDARGGGEPAPFAAVISDGFGSTWTRCDRPDCDLQVVRPGKAQCHGGCEAAHPAGGEA